MPLTPQIYYSDSGLLPLFAHSARRKNVNLPPNVVYLKGTILAEQIGVNAQQTVTLGGSPTGGTFTLTGGALGTTVVTVPYNASAAAMQALLNVGLINPTSLNPTIALEVSGNAGGPYTVTFSGIYAVQPVSLLTASAAGLSGGSPSVAVANLVTGVTGTPGLFWQWDPTQLDGRQVPIGLLEHDASTDGSTPVSNITWGRGGVGAAEWNGTLPYTPMFFQGIFRCSEVIGLTDACLVASGWSLLNGTIASGELLIQGV